MFFHAGRMITYAFAIDHHPAPHFINSHNYPTLNNFTPPFSPDAKLMIIIPTFDQIHSFPTLSHLILILSKTIGANQ